jgi:hypothetical protein
MRCLGEKEQRDQQVKKIQTVLVVKAEQVGKQETWTTWDWVHHLTKNSCHQQRDGNASLSDELLGNIEQKRLTNEFVPTETEENNTNLERKKHEVEGNLQKLVSR